MTRRLQAGFSLVELLVTCALAASCGTLVYSFVRSSFAAARAQQARSEAQDTAHLALSFLTRDLRQAGCALEDFAQALATAEPQRISVRADLNADGDTEDTAESVSYQEDPLRRTLTRAAGASSPQPLADHLEAGSLRFAYWDRDGARLDTGASLAADQRRRVRRVDVRFAIAVPLGRERVRVEVSDSVHLRNAR